MQHRQQQRELVGRLVQVDEHVPPQQLLACVLVRRARGHAEHDAEVRPEVRKAVRARREALAQRLLQQQLGARR